jgi:hypothetical protein
VRRGATVSLDGSASTLAGEYSWKQLSGPAVTIAGATTAKPTYTFPLMSLPTSTTSNLGYRIAPPEPVVIELTVTPPNGTTATDKVTVTPQLETLAITNAEYRSDKREWRVSGTSSIVGQQRVAVTLGTLERPAPRHRQRRRDRGLVVPRHGELRASDQHHHGERGQRHGRRPQRVHVPPPELGRRARIEREAAPPSGGAASPFDAVGVTPRSADGRGRTTAPRRRGESRTLLAALHTTSM